ncbi:MULTISPECIES: helix-turn-helix transcriptional regulator [unclassified Bacillus (in: firmicutes)]|uniref:helix-turn-helix transcriptional regulator n=1 Tax=unclassified Bacillus (in: firmicutes) TaxID=185979 RepID=UPI000CFCE6E6|nr:helix-turn-helix transcriptional regulator [Bacillus sp. MYb209]PQZ50904.1 transcriptional regulator [Bacillus sp. MYb209]
MSVLRNVRETRGLTIQEVSQASKIPVKTLYNIETGKKGIIEKRARILADLFNEPIDKIFLATYYRAKLE